MTLIIDVSVISDRSCNKRKKYNQTLIVNPSEMLAKQTKL